MTNTEALKIIESLADGRCPMTGQILEGVYQQPDVIRALSVAARALERSSPPPSVATEGVKHCRSVQVSLGIQLRISRFAKNSIQARQLKRLL